MSTLALIAAPRRSLLAALRLLCCASLLCFAMASHVAAEATPFDVGRVTDGTPLHPYVSALSDPDGSLTLEDVMQEAHDAAFKPVPTSMAFGFTTAPLWMKLPVINGSAAEAEWLLEISYPLLDYVTLYSVSRDGSIKRQETGDMRPFSTRDVADTNLAFALRLAPHDAATLYLRVQTSGSLRAPLVAWQKTSSYLTSHNRHHVMMWMFYGALFVMMLFNVGVYMLIRQAEYLVYSLLIVALWAVQATLAGHTSQFLFPNHPLTANTVLPVAVSLVILLIPVFARESLGQFAEFSGPAKVARVCVPLGLVLVVFVCLVPPALGIRVVLAAALAIVAASPFMLRSLGKRGNPQLRLYFLSWYCLAGAVPLHILHSINVLPPIPLAEWAIQIGITMHGVITSLALATRLNLARDQLGTLNTQLSANVTDLQLALSRAEQATEEVRRATQVKDEFMATMSHELRTPLNAIINVPQGLLDDFPELNGAACDRCGAHFLLDPGEVIDESTPCGDCGLTGTLSTTLAVKYQGDPAHTARFLRTIERAGKHLLEMVNDVLDFSKMEAGRMRLNYVDVDLKALLHEVVDEMDVLARRKDLTLELVLMGEQRSIEADPLRLRQILFNLLANAIKFSEAGQTVTISWRSEPLAELVSIADQGIGISSENHERVFMSFEQVHKGDTRKYGGTGLGLSISRSLARMHGGDLWVESELGRGSTFQLRVPTAHKPQRASAPSVGEHVSRARSSGEQGYSAPTPSAES